MEQQKRSPIVIDQCYSEVYGTTSITRPQLPTLIYCLISKAELPPDKVQYLCDASLQSPAITKDSSLAPYTSIKSCDLELEALK